MFNIFKKKNKYNVLPNIGRSYVVGQNGEPLLTFYRPNSGLFCNAPLSDDDTPYFLNIRRPVVIDVENVAPTVIPNDLPSECDGIIFLNYGAKKTYRFLRKRYRISKHEVLKICIFVINKVANNGKT
ncbi:MAG: hypothetical protein U0L74_07780 [Paludibacteraceae bacterium]|nr:hypothetical protein [Paludibacteraceae bacterium]